MKAPKEYCLILEKKQSSCVKIHLFNNTENKMDVYCILHLSVSEPRTE